MVRYSVVIKLMIFLFIAACADDTAVQPPTEQERQRVLNDIEQVAIQINDLVGDATAENIEQCEMLPIGAKPCGGPWAYLIFSTAEVEKETLETLVETYTELDDQRNRMFGLVSDCAYVGPPELSFEDNKCRGISAGAWNPGDILGVNNIDDD